MTEEQLDKIYEDMTQDRTFFEAEESINSINDRNLSEELRWRFCNELLDDIAFGYVRYDRKALLKNELVDIFIRQAHHIKELYPIFESVGQFYLGQNDSSMAYLEKAVSRIKPTDDGTYFTEEDFVSYFFEPFKDAYKGFWQNLGHAISKYKCSPGILELCPLLEEYYSFRSHEECLELLIPFSQKYPELSLPKELIAEGYYCLHMWKNAIPYYHKVEDCPLVLPAIVVYFSLAYAYSKIKDLSHVEKYYLKCIELDRTWPYVRNNLGLNYYQQKRYDEALTLFEECLKDKADLPYAANNYVRTFIKQGKNKDAKEFINSGEFKIGRDICERVKKLSNKNEKSAPQINIRNIDEEEDASDAVRAGIDASPKQLQFMSEKILEDELAARIESGREVFGLNLRIYEHEGDYYGRQYPFPFGRLDLLCEDIDNNLYIIELKKDSGYGDVFKQIGEYLDYFEKSRLGKNRKVYGIICLNDPSEKLIGQVRNDDRIRLFEYRVSYGEIR